MAKPDNKGIVTDEIVHIVDLYTSILNLTGCAVPDDRPIDGVPTGFFLWETREIKPRSSFILKMRCVLLNGNIGRCTLFGSQSI